MLQIFYKGITIMLNNQNKNSIIVVKNCCKDFAISNLSVPLTRKLNILKTQSNEQFRISESC